MSLFLNIAYANEKGLICIDLKSLEDNHNLALCHRPYYSVCCDSREEITKELQSKFQNLHTKANLHVYDRRTELTQMELIQSG